MNSKCIVSAACLLPFLAFGETNEWQTAGEGSWHVDANWSLGHAPLAGEDVRDRKSVV